MKRILLLLCAIGGLSACNRSVDMVYVEPIENTLKPDYNLLCSGSNLFMDSSHSFYFSHVSIYLRPFENVGPNDLVTLQLSSDKDSRFVLPNDTLFSGDKINVKYLEFERYIYNLRYETNTGGTHNLSIQTTIKDVSKSTSLDLKTNL